MKPYYGTSCGSMDLERRLKRLLNVTAHVDLPDRGTRCWSRQHLLPEAMVERNVDHGAACRQGQAKLDGIGTEAGIMLV